MQFKANRNTSVPGDFHHEFSFETYYCLFFCSGIVGRTVPLDPVLIRISSLSRDAESRRWLVQRSGEGVHVPNGKF